jgi:putative cell wall-binding protein
MSQAQPQAQTYDEVLLQYESVSFELNKLKKDYEENTIIQSMNDMKEVYDKQTKKMEKMSEVIDNMNETTKAVQLMLKILVKNLSSYSNRRESVTRFELKNKIEFISEILEESLKTKNELYYITYE